MFLCVCLCFIQCLRSHLRNECHHHIQFPDLGHSISAREVDIGLSLALVDVSKHITASDIILLLKSGFLVPVYKSALCSIHKNIINK